MLAKLAEALPAGGGFLYEPKWDGFRAIVYRGEGDVYIQSRDLRPLDRYFPELHDTLLTALPDRCVVDGEIVIASKRGLDFDALQMRLHPAASRVAKLAAETPSSFVAFDVLAAAGKDVRDKPQAERRALLEMLLEGVKPPVHLTPMTRDLKVATDWLSRFEGAGLDGVIAKPEDAIYEPGKRAMIKVKHTRTADCVVAGFRWHKDGKDERVGSLLLGLYDKKGQLQHVGVTSAFSMATRAALVKELAPLRKSAMKDHPWRDWAEAAGPHEMLSNSFSRSARRSACGLSRTSFPAAARTSKATKDEGVSAASFATREAAGCSRICSASKSRPRFDAITISPSTTQPSGNEVRRVSWSSGK